MATIRKLRGRWQAQVRRRGMKPRCKSFDTKLEAEKWARDLEAQVDRFGAAPDTKILESTTLGQLLERYQREVSPLKRGSVQEIQRIDVLRRHDLAYRTMTGLSQQDIASFRDERLQSVAPSTAVRELAILSHVLEVAMRDWGLPLAKNVVKLVRRPVIRNERSRRLAPGEEQRLLDACDVGKIPFLRTLLVVAVETGMRRGERSTQTVETPDNDGISAPKLSKQARQTGSCKVCTGVSFIGKDIGASRRPQRRHLQVKALFHGADASISQGVHSACRLNFWCNSSVHDTRQALD